ncbi:MAG: hypothetical protein HS104_11070 [Polyangiaceae bacterium]|nr:hypothetical protein [Polyangiaceae bacterium]MCE7894331.1 hypothetical protein [Sorangiineae bacterium PRO1]MCL4748672.1 hypothetical protein [Myxococcales bacterium]
MRLRVLWLPALLVWACSSTARNHGSSTGGAAGTAGAGGQAGSAGSAGSDAGPDAGSGSPTLTELHVIPGGAGHHVTDVAISPTNAHVFVVGYGSVAPGYESFVAEVAPGQAEELPRRHFPSSGEAYAEGVVVGGTGSLFLSGFFVKDVKIGDASFTEAAGWGGVVARLIPGPAGDQVDGLSIIGNGNQSFWGNARFGSGSVSVGIVVSGTQLHAQTVNADAAGDALVSLEWSGPGKHAVFAGSGAQRFFDVATDSVPKIYAAGESAGFGDPLLVLGSGAALQLATVVAYDSNLDLEWARAIGSAGDDAFFDVATNPTGNQVVAVGVAKGQVDVGKGSPLPNEGGEDVLIAQLDGKGELKWARTFGGGADDRAYAVAVDSTGDVWVGGSMKSVSIDFGTGPLTKQGLEDGFIVRLDSSGMVRFATLFGGSGADSISALGATAGRVVAVGKFEKKFDFLSTEIAPVSTNPGVFDFAVLDLTP